MNELTKVLLMGVLVIIVVIRSFLKTIGDIYRKHIRASGRLISVACDADLCATYPAAQKIREEMTVKTAREIHIKMQRTPG